MSVDPISAEVAYEDMKRQLEEELEIEVRKIEKIICDAGGIPVYLIYELAARRIRDRNRGAERI